MEQESPPSTAKIFIQAQPGWLALFEETEGDDAAAGSSVGLRSMTDTHSTTRVHLIAGGFPVGSHAGHDIDRVRLDLLGLLANTGPTWTSVSSDFQDLVARLPKTDFLVTYVAGPMPDDAQCDALLEWLAQGGRWLALHGTSGGKAVPLPDGRPGRIMKRSRHHDVLGAYFLNHPPIRRFQVERASAEHPVTDGLPASFEVADELYLLELTAPEDTTILLTTRDLPADDPAPRKFGFTYEEDTSIAADGESRVLGYERRLGEGAVIYVGLGHCHTPTTNIQPWVHESVDPDGTTPLSFRGPWETEAFRRLVENAIAWGTAAR